MFRGSGGTWQRDSVADDFVVPLYHYHHSSSVFVQQIAGSDRNVVCLLFHRICGCGVIVFDLSETYDDKIEWMKSKKCLDGRNARTSPPGAQFINVAAECLEYRTVAYKLR